MISFKCPTCDKAYKVNSGMQGKRFRCKSCQQVLSVPNSKSKKRQKAKPKSKDDAFLDALTEAADDEYYSEAVDLPAPMPVSAHKPKPKKKKKSVQNIVFPRPFKILMIIAFCCTLLSNGLKIVAKHLKSLKQQRQSISAVQWQEFSPPQKEFTVLLPSKPKHIINQLPSDGVLIKPIQNIYTAEGDKFACIISTTPTDVVVNGVMDMDQAFKNARMSVRKRFPNSNIISEKNIQLDGYSGLEFELIWKKTTTNKTWVHIYIVPGIVLIVAYVEPVNDSNESARDIFFKSLSLKEASI